MDQNFDFNNQPPQNSQSQTRYVTYIPYGMTPEEYEEKKALKKTANTIGGSFLIVLAINVGIFLIYSLILVFLSFFGINIPTNIFDNPAFLQILQAVLSIFIFTFPFILLFKVMRFRISDLISFKKPQKEDFIPFLLLGISFCAFSNIAVSFMGNFFSSFGVNYEVDFGQKPSGILGFMLTTIATAVVPSLVEEFACRGVVLGALRKFGDGFAVVCSAAVFGIMHGNFQQIPFAFLVGLVLGFIVVKTDTIWIAVAVHFFNNFVSVILDYLSMDLSVPSQNVIYSIYLVFCLFGGIFAVYLLKDKQDVYKLKKAENHSANSKLYKWFFASPTIIIFIVICFIESLAFFKP